MPSRLEKLKAIQQPFRTQYLAFDAIERQLHAWADTFPDIARLQSIGTSEQGRPLWMLVLGRLVVYVALLERATWEARAN